MNRKLACMSAAIVLTAAGLATGQATTTVAPDKLLGDLATVIAEAQPDELIPITIMMTEQADRGLIEQYKQLPKAERRDAVIGLLQAVANNTQDGVLDLLNRADADGKADRIKALWIANVVVAHVTPDVALALAARNDVATLHWDRPLPEDAIRPVQPEIPGEGSGEITLGGVTCGVDLIGAPNVWDFYNNRGEGVVVGVIDTGLCYQHADVADHLWNNPGEIANNGIDDDNNGFIDDVVGWDFRDNDNDPSDPGSGHGTHTCGTVAGDGANGTQTGVAPNCTLMPIRYNSSISAEGIAWQCIEYSVLMDCDVISNSYGWIYNWNPQRSTWRMVTENTIAAGVICVWAAGNEGNIFGPPRNVRCPADVPGVITVGAIDCNNNAAGFTSRGPVSWSTISPYFDHPYPPGLIKPDVCAPGVNTLSLDNSPCNGYSTKSGTSMACPHVAGLCALILSANPDLTPEQVKEILEVTADDLGQAGKDTTFGSGRVNAFAAVTMALDMVGGCNTDWDGNGSVNAADVGAFLSDYFEDLANGTLNADYDGNGSVNAADVGAFLSDYFVELADGCE